MAGAFFRPPGQKTTTPGDYNATPTDRNGQPRPFAFAPGNDVDLQVSSITEGYKRILSMQVPYYKINLNESQTNIYGESLSKWYYQPVMIKCHFERSDETYEMQDYGSSKNQTAKIFVVREMMVQQNLLPEVGDIILDRERYYEITNVNENHIMFGNDEQYIYYAEDNNSYSNLPSSSRFDSSSLQDRGRSLVFEMDSVMISPTKLNLLPYKIQ